MFDLKEGFDEQMLRQFARLLGPGKLASL
jgi:hypothetical protein